MSPTSVRGESHALADPSRFAVFEALRAADAPLLVKDLAAQIPVHHNAIRAHLKVLIDVGLVRREQAPAVGRGRPAHTYALTPEAIARWSTTDTHEELSIMLLELVTSGDTPREVGRRAGLRLREVVPSATGDGVTPPRGRGRRGHRTRLRPRGRTGRHTPAALPVCRDRLPIARHRLRAAPRHRRGGGRSGGPRGAGCAGDARPACRSVPFHGGGRRVLRLGSLGLEPCEPGVTNGE